VNLMGLAIAIVSGAVAGALAYMIVGAPKDDRGKFSVTFVVIFIVIYALSRIYFLPHANGWYEVKRVEAELQGYASFRAVKKYDAKVYQAMLDDIRKVVMEGGSRDQALGAARIHMIALVKARLPTASNESVAAYMDIMMAELGVLEKKGGDSCYRFLFPQSGAPLDFSGQFSKKMQKDDLDALAEVIESSASDPQPLPDQEEVVAKLQVVYSRMVEEYGEEIGLLDNAAGVTGEADKRRICDMTGSLYDKILAQPAHESGKILRFMMSQVP
jgi:hypothetical protein